MSMRPANVPALLMVFLPLISCGGTPEETLPTPTPTLEPGDDPTLTPTPEPPTPTHAPTSTPLPDTPTASPVPEETTLPGGVYPYDVPLKGTSPWPRWRRTPHNDGRSPLKPTQTGRQPWHFPTAKGIFHSPVIDEDGTVYIGTGSTYFYAIDGEGHEKWRFKTGEIIDSTALLADDGTIFVPAGDGNLYALNPDGTKRWSYQAAGQDGYITWWEGHLSMQSDGTLLAGNDDYHLYALRQDGSLEWTFETLDQVWSAAAVDSQDQIFLGCNDMMVRGLSADGEGLWQNVTKGPVASSPALNAAENLLVVGSFDGYVHGIDPARGRALWSFEARDHLYSSPAIARDGTLYIGSADGTLYALNPDGSLRWAYDTLDPIRSSPAIDGDGNVYFGGGDGRVYALRPDGTRLWSYDTSEGDRNDLNGSPALDPDGVIIGGEAGTVHFLPWDYCARGTDERCSLEPGEDLPADGPLLYFLTSGGTSLPAPPENVTPLEVLTFRLVVREEGDTIRARIDPESLAITLEPAQEFRYEISADGQFVSVIPAEALALAQVYTINLSGDYLVGGVRTGNKVTGGRVGGSFRGSLELQTAGPTGQAFPLERTDERVSVLHLSRLAAPQPPMLTTFNQIGFDSYNYLLGVVSLDPESRQVIMLAVEGLPGVETTLNPATRSIFPLNGSYVDGYFQLSGYGSTLEVTGVNLELDLFRLAGQLDAEQVDEKLNVYAEVTCANVEEFGAVLELLGLCNPDSGRMIVNGTGMFHPQNGIEGVRPEGLEVLEMSRGESGGLYAGGWLEARFGPNTLLAEEHLPVILLLDPVQGEAVPFPYGEAMEKVVGADGSLEGVRLNLPLGITLTGLQAVVLMDLFPLETFLL